MCPLPALAKAGPEIPHGIAALVRGSADFRLTASIVRHGLVAAPFNRCGWSYVGQQGRRDQISADQPNRARRERRRQQLDQQHAVQYPDDTPQARSVRSIGMRN
jgi:hypothetical protein